MLWTFGSAWVRAFDIRFGLSERCDIRVWDWYEVLHSVRIRVCLWHSAQLGWEVWDSGLDLVWERWHSGRFGLRRDIRVQKGHWHSAYSLFSTQFTSFSPSSLGFLFRPSPPCTSHETSFTRALLSRFSPLTHLNPTTGQAWGSRGWEWFETTFQVRKAAQRKSNKENLICGGDSWNDGNRGSGAQHHKFDYGFSWLLSVLDSFFFLFFFSNFDYFLNHWTLFVGSLETWITGARRTWNEKKKKTKKTKIITIIHSRIH